MKKLILAIAALGVAAMPLVAQQHRADPDKKMAGPGTLPSGWKGRLDSGDQSLAGVKASQMGGGVHFMTGPAGIFYKPADRATGAYETHATFTQSRPRIRKPTACSSAARISTAPARSTRASSSARTGSS